MSDKDKENKVLFSQPFTVVICPHCGGMIQIGSVTQITESTETKIVEKKSGREREVE